MIGKPNCKTCHGTGEREIITVRDGVIESFQYERCACTYHTQWVDDEDWSNARADLRRSN